MRIKKNKIKKIIFTNGCFDILHAGHVNLIKSIKKKFKDDYLVIGLNSDRSVKKIKGENKPINSQKNRKLILESLKYVDKVIIFNELTPLNLIKKIKPDIIVKGADYKKKDIVGLEIVGIKNVYTFKIYEELSTSKIIKKLNLKNF